MSSNTTSPPHISCRSSRSCTADRHNSARIDTKGNVDYLLQPDTTDLAMLVDDGEFVGLLPPPVAKRHIRSKQSSMSSEGRPISLCATDTQLTTHTDLTSSAPLNQLPQHNEGTGYVPSTYPLECGLQGSIGTLSRLPLELRFQVYSHVIDHDFKQHYWFDDDTVWLKPSSTKLPSIAHVSKRAYGEIIAALQNGRPCRLTVAAGVITANFMLFDFSNGLPRDTDFCCSEGLHIPSCKEVVISLQRPRPRNASDMVEVRQTVENLVRILNSVTLPLPRLRITFETNGIRARRASNHQVVHNDYALLVGPLYKLENAAANGIAIDRPHSQDGTVDKRSHDICTMIETAVRGNISRELVVQQLCLDIKLPISTHLSDSEIRCKKDSPYTAYSAILCNNTTGLLYQLARSYVEQEKAVPLWVKEAAKLMSGGSVPFSILKGQVAAWFGDSWVYDASVWASGHLTGWNPFYDEETESSLDGTEGIISRAE